MSAINYADALQALAIEYHNATKAGDTAAADRILADMMRLHRSHKSRILADMPTR